VAALQIYNRATGQPVGQAPLSLPGIPGAPMEHIDIDGTHLYDQAGI
jgi:hypothetical protein